MFKTHTTDSSSKVTNSNHPLSTMTYCLCEAPVLRLRSGFSVV